MSSTSNAQDLLVNVFRPTYRWDPTTGFVPSLTVSNVSEVITGSVKTDRLAVSDSNLNTYIGSNAGANAIGTASNVALGYSAMGGSLNSSNNVAVGLFSLDGLTDSDCNVALGARTDINGRGQRNVLIGPNVTMGDGSGNILIGVDISAGNVSKRFQLGTLLYGDLSSGFVGINTSAPAAALDISGIVVFRNKVGFQNANPDYSLDVAGSVYASEQFIGSNGSRTYPLFTFKDSPGTGMYVPALSEGFGVGAFAIAVTQSPAAVFSSNQVNFYKNLDVSGTFSARGVVLDGFAVENGTAGVPTMTFKNDSSSGLYLVSSNRIGVSTAGLRRMEFLSNGDVSMARLVTKDISYSGTIVGTDPTTCNVIGGVTLCNGYVTTTGTSSSSNLVVTGFIRNSDPATQFDISSGNISNSLTTRSSNFRASAGTAGVPAYSFASDPSSGVHSSGTSQIAFDTSGVQRMCISGGFVGIGKANPTVALEVVGDVSATTYNGPGGTQGAPHYTFSDDRTTGVFFPGANIVGLTAGGTERMRISNSNIGIGTTAPTNALDVSGTLRVIGTAGDLTFSNGTISLAGVPVISSTGVLSNATSTSNSIGGVTLSNTVVRVGNGTDSVPTIAFSSDTNTGLYRFGAGTIGVVSGGNAVARLSTASSVFYTDALTTLTLSNRQLLAQNGTAAAPSHSFVVRPDMGLYLAAADQLGVSIGGVVRSTFSNGDFSNSGVTRSSNFLAAPGGAARPAYAFTTDPSSGLDLVGTSYLAFDTSGVQRMCISGNLVGIGTAAPAVRMDISGRTRIVQDGSASLTSWGLNNQADTLILQHTGSYTTAADLGKSASLLFANATLNNPQARIVSEMTSVTPATFGANLIFQTNSQGAGLAERMRIHSNGYVGIGMSAPVSALDVVGPSDGDGKAVIQVKNSSTGQGIVRVVGSNQANTTGLELFHTGSYGGLYLPAGISNLSFWTAGARQMDIVNGRIGVGNATPSATLDLAAAGAWIAVNRNGNIPFVSDVSMIVEGGNGVGLYFQKGDNNNFCGISIKTLCNNTLAERFRVDANTGRIGIGTTAPGNLLTVVAPTQLGYANRASTTPSNYQFAISAGGGAAVGLYSGAYYTTGQGAASTIQSSDSWNGTVNPAMLLLNPVGGAVGVNCNAPGYSLDVKAAATDTASVNMSTWSRTAGSNTLFVRGAISIVGNAIIWSNATQAIDTNLATWNGNDTTNASSFIIKKSGIWAFSFVSIYSTTGVYIAVDVSTNNAASATIDGNLPIIAQTQLPTSVQSLSWTGYLPSNTGRYYKFRSTANVYMATTSNWYFQLTFLGESGQSIAFPY